MAVAAGSAAHPSVCLSACRPGPAQPPTRANPRLTEGCVVVHKDSDPLADAEVGGHVNLRKEEISKRGEGETGRWAGREKGRWAEEGD